MEVQETKRLKHYNNKQKILLVGEGDFSFSLSLARAFGSATNLIATSLDSQVERFIMVTERICMVRASHQLRYPEVTTELERNYKNGKANVEELERLGCNVVFGVNVHSMTTKPNLGCSATHDRVIFNFPHAGFDYGREHEIKTIMRHQELVRGFMKSARLLVKDEDKGGEIHVVHKTEYPFSEWKLKTLGEKEGLELVSEIEFCLNHYPGYSNKRGSRGYNDSSFPVGKSSTFIFKKHEIIAQPLVTKQKNISHFYEYSPSKSSESSEMLEVVWTTEV
ncbi:hypothetical protein YC2023_118270 [Brassica napus]